jgi:Domain of unknown function (DUF4430)
MRFARRSFWSRCLAGAIALATLVSATAAPSRPALAADKSKASTVSMTVDYNDGVRKVFVLSWTKDMTVLDAMNLAKANPHGLTYASTGSGETAFLTKIDDLRNEGGGTDKKNWVYWVNDVLADRGFGVSKLEKGDSVLWKFDTYREDSAGKK